ncbi:hypothetical protein RM780_10075 [Streptomyces sp. DSM 44917]|uniref:Uncharacterized protein n=1 Tax=Streptomyces boetiae TaxID=3075541 RepID=A0ABU2L6X0_9ACTN|nr:hypothetical protein [Streptomyces sp. DSM 44917]MDT0307309.1 hypothetical protein [Streptomyces sp. DSM 44917]
MIEQPAGGAPAGKPPGPRPAKYRTVKVLLVVIVFVAVQEISRIPLVPAGHLLLALLPAGLVLGRRPAARPHTGRWRHGAA